MDADKIADEVQSKMAEVFDIFEANDIQGIVISSWGAEPNHCIIGCNTGGPEEYVAAMEGAVRQLLALLKNNTRFRVSEDDTKKILLWLITKAGELLSRRE